MTRDDFDEAVLAGFLALLGSCCLILLWRDPFAARLWGALVLFCCVGGLMFAAHRYDEGE